jgi:filamentous hemagglutinin family protein
VLRLNQLSSLIAASLVPVTFATSGNAQVISAGDRTGTVVNQNGSDFAITGGSFSGDGHNLFHNFSQLDLNSSQSATFLANPNIQNILSKISGDRPSYIDGLLSISNSNANLFLFNPSGILFGSNAQLNLAGDFTASTASTVSFGDKTWTDSANFSTLIGSPTSFSFDGIGAIINAADLAVEPGKTINLFASNVVNTGSLTAEQGKIQIMAVPGTNNLRLSQTGQILDLEFAAPEGNLVATNLAELLTGSDLETGLDINVNGNVILDANQSIVNAQSGATTITGSLDTTGTIGGDIGIFGQNIVLVDANLDASGINGGGEILVGGEYQGQGNLPRAAITVVDMNSELKASATDTGNGGRVIVWSDDQTDFDGYIFAKGGINSGDGGFVEISSKGILDLAPGWSQRVNVSAVNGTNGSLLLDPSDINIVNSTGIPITGSPTSDSILTYDDINNFLGTGADLEITTAGGTGGVGNITFDSGGSLAWTTFSFLKIVADNNISGELNAVLSGGGSIELIATNDISITGDITASNGSNIYLDATNSISGTGNIDISSGSASLYAGDSIFSTGSIDISGGYASLYAGNSISGTGNINISDGASAYLGANNSILGTGNITATGNSYISLSAYDSISGTGDITASNGSNIYLNATNFIFGTGNIDISSFSYASLYAGDSIFSTGSIDISGSYASLYAGNSIFGTGDITASDLINFYDGIDLSAGKSIVLTNQNITLTGIGYVGLSAFDSISGPVTINASGGGNVYLSANSISGEQNITSSGGGSVSLDTVTGETNLFTTEATNRVFGGGGFVSFAGDGGTLYINGGLVDSCDVSLDCDIEWGSGDEWDDDEKEEEDKEEDDKEEDDKEEDGGGENNGGGENEAFEMRSIQTTMDGIRQQTNQNPAMLYFLFRAPGSNPVAQTRVVQTKQHQGKDDPQVAEVQWEFRGDRLTDFLNISTNNFLNPRGDNAADEVLELVLVTSDGQITKKSTGTTRGMVMREVSSFMRGVTDPRFGNTFLSPAQKLYDYLIRPLEAGLSTTEINNLAFVMDDGLRLLPMAALHDGEQFLVEKYSIGMMPSFSLVNTSSYVPPSENRLLAMGASTFVDQNDLPAAPFEVELITKQIWQQGDDFLNQDFTVENLIAARDRQNYGIIHLATHGEFLPGNRENSYIQFQDRRLPLSEIQTLGLNDPPLELLILSACRTAYGDRSAELGFAGLALASGAKAAIGSTWYVSDEGTLSLMTQLYEELKTAPIKAEALRQAQLAMLHGEVRIEDHHLVTKDLRIPLPEELQYLSDRTFTHPYYWSAFTLVGNPW